MTKFRAASTKFLAAVALAASSLLLPIMPVPRAHACSCEAPNVERNLEQSTGAIIGTFLGRGEDGGEQGNFDFDSTEYRFEVDEWVKGRGGDTLSVWSAPNGAGCGLEIPVGQRAGLFLELRNGKASSSLCSTVAAGALAAAPPVDGPGQDFTEARVGRPTSIVGDVPIAPRSFRPIVGLAVGLGGFIVIAGVFIFAIDRLRRNT